MGKCQSCHTNIQECDKCIGYDHYNPNKDKLKERRKGMANTLNESEGNDELQGL